MYANLDSCRNSGDSGASHQRLEVLPQPCEVPRLRRHGHHTLTPTGIGQRQQHRPAVGRRTVAVLTESLDGSQIDLFAAGDHNIIDPAQYLEQAIVEPAPILRSHQVVAQDFSGEVGAEPVATEDHRPSEVDALIVEFDANPVEGTSVVDATTAGLAGAVGSDHGDPCATGCGQEVGSDCAASDQHRRIAGQGVANRRFGQCAVKLGSDHRHIATRPCRRQVFQVAASKVHLSVGHDCPSDRHQSGDVLGGKGAHPITGTT